MANTELDLCFLCDATGSMGSYIAAAQQNICAIATKVSVSECADVRFALVSYRDHPPQDSSYVTRVFPFTPDVAEMQSYVSTMSASGGGDGPEAVTAALDDALHLPWRPNATKVAVLIADAPPHGLEPSGDGFPDGDPEGRDPLELARTMAAHGITVYAVGCEPALGSYRFARDFMCTLAETTGGQAVALSSAKNLADVIINGSAEEISLTLLSREVEEEVERVRGLDAEASDEQVFQQAASNLQSRSVKSKHMRHDGMMKQAAPEVWSKATSLKAAKAELCSKMPPGSPSWSTASRSRGAVPMSMDFDGLGLESLEEKSCVMSASEDFSFGKKSKKASRPSFLGGAVAAVSSFFGGDTYGEGDSSSSGDRETVRAASLRASPAMTRGLSLKEARPAGAMPSAGAMAAPGSSAPKTLEKNVLEEDDISFEQVKRIATKSMHRKSAA